MYSVYQHWDPLKTCIVGKSYPPEFYSWIKNPKTRSIFERIAQETEEDYQSLIKILEKFNVEILRPDIPEDHSLLFDTLNNMYVSPPMTPRDYTGMYGDTLIFNWQTIQQHYNDVKDTSWPEVKTHMDVAELPSRIKTEITRVFNLDFYSDRIYENNNDIFFGNLINKIQNKCTIKNVRNNSSSGSLAGGDVSSASVTRIGKDLYIDKASYSALSDNVSSEFRINPADYGTHSDACYCPVVPGLIISLNDIQTYQDTFPDWEVVYLPDQSWDKVQPFLDLKRKNKGKWWIPGEEYNDDVIEVVDTWLSKWVGYVEETVFDVNMLVINEKNVIVNNYNKQVFDALERYGVTPHICNFRHRYFWDGGLHCITSDLDREGEMKDYFPERG